MRVPKAYESNMKKIGSIILFLLFIVSSKAQDVHPYITNPEVLKSNVELLGGGNNASVKRAMELIQEQGSVILKRRAKSVVEKSIVPPSGDKHDFISLAGYYWPDPSKKNGLPYINKDGKWNPEASKIPDRSNLIQLCKDVRTLGVLFYYTKDEKYALKAKEFLTCWFLNDATKMNPNLSFAQGIRGKNDGRAVGLVDTRELVDLLDGVQLLSGSKAWTQQCNNELKGWFEKYLNWLLNSNIGKAGQNLTNNIGTAYLAQVVCFALYTDKPDLAYSYFEKQVPKLLDAQFDEDGKQPLELKRNDAWMYSNSNLNQWLKLLQMSDLVKFDLWNYDYAGKSIEKAYSWLLPYANGDNSWEYGKKDNVDMKATFDNNKKRVELHKMSNNKSALSLKRSVSNVRTNVLGVSNKDSKNEGTGTSINKNNAINFLTEVNF